MSDPLNGPVLLIYACWRPSEEFLKAAEQDNKNKAPIFSRYANRKIVFTIRLDKSLKVPKWICVSGFSELTKRGNPLPPESKSKFKYFQSINDLAIHAMNTYVSYEEVPVLALIHWCKKYSEFPDKICKITEKRLYWNQDYGFLPPDYCSIDVKENDLIHKSSIVYKNTL